jgi:hypothetical protein
MFQLIGFLTLIKKQSVEINQQTVVQGKELQSDF